MTSLLGGGKYLWQMHSSGDDRVHSATVKDSNTYQDLGCLVYREDTHQHLFFTPRGDYDECQIDKSGRWLVIKENVDNAYNEDNRVIDIETGAEQVLWDQNGAAGHSDMGYGYIVGEDDKWAREPVRRPCLAVRPEHDLGAGQVWSTRCPPGAVQEWATSRTATRSPVCPISDHRWRAAATLATSASRAPTRSSASDSTARCGCSSWLRT